MPAVQKDIPEEHWSSQIYEALVLRGIDPHDMVPNFEQDGSHVALALPGAKVALASDGDAYDGLLEDDWRVVSIPLGAMKSFASTFRELNTIAADYRVRVSGAAMVKMGSADEARLLDGIVRAHLPDPDRNLRIMRDDGSGQELAVPDFAWPDQMVAFFMDGLWWHHGRDSDTAKKVLLGEADTDLLGEAERQQLARATRDANNRSELGVLGWLVLSCSDEEIQDDPGVIRQVERIKRALKGVNRGPRQRGSEVAAQPTGAVPGSIDDLFGVDD